MWSSLKQYKILLSLCVLFLHGVYSRKCGKNVYMTYATSDLTAISASVLSQSLKHTGSKHCCILLVTNDVSWLIRPFLKGMFDDIIDVDLKTSNNRILHEDYGLIWLWKNTKYDKIAFLQNSVVVLNNTDDIFNETPLAAVPDVGWPDRFDTNVMLLQPNKKVFNKLRKTADKEVRNEREGPESAKVEWLITSLYPDWNRLSCIYNIHYTLQDTNRDAYRRLQHTIKIVRFTGENKPWTIPLNIDSNLPEVYVETVGHIYIELLFHEKWWNIFSKYVHAKLKKYLRKYNLHLVIKDRHLFLGNVDFHVDAGFFNLKGKSCPKMVVRNNKSVSNQYSTWRQLLQGIQGWQDVGLEL